ncbi:TadE/TadG family type IV pilus assembly protein [Sphingomonas sp. NBWT7]|uniref:TadE/TadG family type IV pilus assembly protein n=1 Tax=Sphingomonas sp. NBWT7 TaxID=2596913 RepID=UPI00162701E8|nr:Tad domain-containing protein [Sphingomonas sp. NBWT7]
MRARENIMATFLGRLRRDRRGNTLAIMAAAMIPLIAMIGSGIDMTRAYMAQNRFRQACDAGSLAGRRLLSGLTVTQNVRDEATKYFTFNFPQGQFQSAAYTLAMSIPTAGTLRIASETTIPTTLMKIFGFNTLPISATCSATQDFVNTDLMLVFDLSGSMNCAPGGVGDCGGVNQPNSKLDALKAAAKALYATLEPAQDQLYANNLRMRYGFVNYSSGVNVGEALYQKNSSNFVTRSSYQSRIPALDDNSKTRAWCDAKLGNFTEGYVYNFWTGRNEYYRNCRYPVDYNTGTWLYREIEHDVTSYLAGGTPFLLSRNRASTRWAGCIEERLTDSAIIDGGAATTAPTSAYDLDIDLPPNDDSKRWRPAWPDTYFEPNSLRPTSSFYCPTAARRLRNYYGDKSGFENYVDSLDAIGGTYHDLGMIWGARFISPTGIFAASPSETNDLTTPDNPVKIRGFGVKKYIIFMTDGEMKPEYFLYSPYGVESLDQRVTAGASNLLDRHLQRFRMACNAAKAKGIDVWVIAFATTLTTDMQNCASKPEQAAGLSTNAALIAKFQEIGSKIGSLRLSQ